MPLDKDVSVYLYKCLLRRKHALQSLKPIDIDPTPFDDALNIFIGSMHPDDICEADKQMRVSRAKNIEIHIDASARDHDNPEVPNKVSISFIISEEGNVIYEKAQYLGSYITLEIEGVSVTLDITVNVAEYLALIRALEFIIENDFKGIVTIFSDSQLIVRQINFTSSARAPKLIVLRDYAKRLKDKLRYVQIVHLNREENTSADALAKSAKGEDEDI